MNKVEKWSELEFRQFVLESNSLTSVSKKLGYKSSCKETLDKIKNRIEQLDISIEHFNNYSHAFIARNNYELEEILVQNSPYTNLTTLKDKLLKVNLKEYKCDICGIYEWLGNPLSLQLDHINGVNNDHRIENIRFLCPNCHSQTDTFCRKK